LLLGDTSGNKKSIGNRGEKVARAYLKKKGWKIISTNVHTGKGEIDVIALSPSQEILAVVEVRTTANIAGNPEGTISAKKRRAMKLAAMRFRNDARRYTCVLRIDVITVRLLASEHIIRHYKGVMRI
jgi:putative endonuclease